MSISEVPIFDDQFIAKILMDLYGIEGEISTLVSYEDQNILIKTPGSKYVLKIANKRWPLKYLQAQNDILEFLRINAPELTFPHVVPTLEGSAISSVNGFSVRLLTFLEGELFTNIPKTPELYQDVGRFLGQLSKVMTTYSVDSIEGPDEMWSLDNVMACKAYHNDIVDKDVRDQIERLFEYYEKNILPKLHRLRKAVIHGDPNEQNFLVDPLNPTKIAGLIDFGDMRYGSQINDLAIALAYGLLEEDDIEMASSKIIEGYDREFKLEAEEREILFHLMAMRLVATISMSSHNAKLQPDNEYILVSQKPARDLLKRLEEEKYILV
jgi:Ser/Thr protein kinase RdoA (MazF antagonist)